MGNLFAYSIVAGLLLLAMYPVYKWLMAGEKQYGFNRTIIWTIYLAALLLPLLVPTLKELSANFTAAESPAAGTINIGIPQITVINSDIPSWIRVLLRVYLAGILISFACTVIVAFKLRSIIAGGEKIKCGNYTLILTDNSATAPFSWLRFIVMNRNDYLTSGNAIIIHETRHLDLAHWADLIVAQCVAILMWYNPVAWLMREELKAVHEYQADEAVIRSGLADIKEYQMLLVKKAVGARFPSLANSLNHSKLKKRITMMQKNRSNAVRRLRAIALLPAAAVAVATAGTIAVSSLLTMASAATLGTKSDDKIKENNLTLQDTAEKPVKISELDSQPEFPGGIAEVVKWLQYNLKYPQEALNTKTEGKVVVKFVVDRNGKVKNPEILRSVSPALDNEALRVISEMPEWTPAMFDGKPVDCHYVCPVSFKIPDPAR